MEKSYFTSLNTNAKIEFIYHYGEIVSEFETSEHYVSLFLLGNFYVEVSLNKLSNELENIVIQDQNDNLYNYVKNIELGHLTNWFAN